MIGVIDSKTQLIFEFITVGDLQNALSSFATHFGYNTIVITDQSDKFLGGLIAGDYISIEIEENKPYLLYGLSATAYGNKMQMRKHEKLIHSTMTGEKGANSGNWDPLGRFKIMTVKNPISANELFEIK